MSDYKKVLVAVDFSPFAKDVVKRAVDLANRFRAELLLLHVVEYLPPVDIGYDPLTSTDWVLDEKALVDSARSSLKALAADLGLHEAGQVVEIGSARYVIAQVAEEQSADLIVIGSHGRRGLGRLLGSTADGVLHNARCDVLAVRVQNAD